MLYTLRLVSIIPKLGHIIMPTFFCAVFGCVTRYLDAEEMMSALQELGMLEGMRPRQLGVHTSICLHPVIMLSCSCSALEFALHATQPRALIMEPERPYRKMCMRLSKV